MATLKDIANECGISPQTVSRILNSKHDHLYRKETCDLVKQTARKMNYRPNLSAQAIRSGKSKAIVLLSSQDPSLSHIPEKMLYSIRSTLGELGYSMEMSALSMHADDGQKELERILANEHISGILVSISKSIPDWLKASLNNSSVPTVWIGSRHESNCIIHNDFESARDITLQLISSGHRSITYVDYMASEEERESWHFSTLERMEGYKSAMMESNLAPCIICPGKTICQNEMVAYTSANIFSNGNIPSAIITYDMEITGRACLYSALKNGLNIPEDLSFVTYSSKPVIENDLFLACFVPSQKNVGYVAVAMLHDLISGQCKNIPAKELNFAFVKGESIAVKN
jgi:DNA-binding LacI/PurR family transcriptional regulator